MSEDVPQPDERQLARFAHRSDAFEELGPVARKGEILEEWMMTYMDTVTLLVTLFVLILSLTTVSEEKFNALAEGLRIDKYGHGILMGSPSVMDLSTPSTNDMQTEGVGPTVAIEPQMVADRLEELIASADLADQIEIEISDDLIDLQLNESVLFLSGSSELLPGGKGILENLTPLLKTGQFIISVQGHTDSVPISSEIYPSNWELSGARSASVVRALILSGVAEDRMEMVGFAHTRPIASNDDAEGRSKNRRVNILLNASPEEVEQLLKR